MADKNVGMVAGDDGVTAYETLAAIYGEDLAAEQLRLEAESYKAGEERFQRNLETNRTNGTFSGTSVSKPLVQWAVPAMITELEDFIELMSSGRPGKKASSFALLKPLQMDRVAYIGIRATINCIMQKDSSLVDVTMAIGRSVEEEARYGRIRDIDEKNYTKRIAPNIKKRSAEHYKKAYAQAVERAMYEQEVPIQKWDSWTALDRNSVGLKIVEILINLGIIERVQVNPGNPELHKQMVVLTPEVTKYISSRTDALAGLNPSFSPCVVPPKPWVGTRVGGYWSKSRSNPGLLKIRSKRTLRRYRDVDLSGVTEAVNLIQNTPWTINTDVLAVAEAVALQPNPIVSGFPSLSMLPLPVQTFGTPEENPKGFTEWKKAAAEVHRRERTRVSQRLSMDRTLREARKFSRYERIWFPYNLDFRGRVYAIPSYSPQGTDLAKGTLLLADPVPMGKDGGYWLRMHLANTAGLDKEPMDVRQKWTYDNEELILDTAENPMGCTFWATEADSPFCFLAACIEFRKFKLSGESEGHLCGLPIAFDGSCSGIQHFSGMLKDEIGGGVVNLIPKDKPDDVYRTVADKVQIMIDGIISSGTDDYLEALTDEETGEIKEIIRYGTKSMAKWWNDYGITRKVTKRSVMVLPYGSKEYGFADHILEDTVEPANAIASGYKPFPAPRSAASFMAGLIWEALGVTVVAAVKTMNWLQKVSAAVVAQGQPVHWITPMGFPVWQEYRSNRMHRVDTVICGSIRICIKVKEDEREDEQGKPLDVLDKRKNVSSVSPNFIHSMDSSHLMLTVTRANLVGVGHFAMIHDSFGTCPGNASDMFRVVRETFVETYTKYDVLTDFYRGFEDLIPAKEIKKLPKKPDVGSLDLSGVLESKYCFA